MTQKARIAAPKGGAAVAGDDKKSSPADAGSKGCWTLFHGVRMTKRLKTHVLMDPEGNPAIYARTLDEVLFHLYDRDVAEFVIVEGRRLWHLRIVGPPGVPPERTELDYG